MSIQATLVYYDEEVHKQVERAVTLRELTPTLYRPLRNKYKKGWPLDKEPLNYYESEGKHYYCQLGIRPIGAGFGLFIE